MSNPIAAVRPFVTRWVDGPADDGHRVNVYSKAKHSNLRSMTRAEARALAADLLAAADDPGAVLV